MKSPYEAGKDFLRGGYTAYTPDGADFFKKNGAWFTTPSEGYVVYFYNSNLKRIGHVGIVVSVDRARKTFKTVEGNTSSKEFTTNGGICAGHEYSYAAVGGTNRVQGFGKPYFAEETCYASEFIDVARAWLDYEEKRTSGTDAQLQEKHWNPGSNNYTWFGRWYGIENGQWCQMFVSYCAYQACKLHRTFKKTGWEAQPDGRWKYFVEGRYVAGKWLMIDNRWYVFDEAGYMITGWFGNEADGWYYLNPADGAMLSGQWLEDKDKWYYLTKTGLMATYCYVLSSDGTTYYWLNENGVWEPEWNTAAPDLNKYELVI